jgi:hypothetical protein
MASTIYSVYDNISSKNIFNPLFESIMPVLITITVVLIAAFYFKDVDTKFLNEGIKIGLNRFIKVLIDLILFMPYADEFHKLYDGYWTHIPLNTYCDCGNGLNGG